MKKITMFILASCPYCIEALRWMDEVLEENERYRLIEVEVIDERKRPDIANKRDYYYVPTYYVGEKKLHEGVATKKKVMRVFAAAMDD